MRKHPISDTDSKRPAGNYDPVQRADGETHSFNTAWLKNGESLTLFQRIGFTIFSLAFFGIGIGLVKFLLLEIRDSDLIFTLIFGASSVFFILFGGLGLRNVLRFGDAEDARHKRSN
jgi:hypothetical protein